MAAAVRLSQDGPFVGDDDADVDIIAIHGLDTRSPETWEWRDGADGQQVNWLSASCMLPSQVGSARILTCNWPADAVQQSASIPLTLKELARRLLAAILDTRRHPSKANLRATRPILFIASCLGGIVLMEALGIADHPDSDYHALRKATRGIVFLATPFRGTSFESVARWAVPLLNAKARLRGQIVTNLFDSIKGPTDKLQELVRNFIRLCLDKNHPCRVFTFYETEKTVLERKLYSGPLATWLFEPKLVRQLSRPVYLQSRHS